MEKLNRAEKRRIAVWVFFAGLTLLFLVYAIEEAIKTFAARFAAITASTTNGAVTKDDVRAQEPQTTSHIIEVTSNGGWNATIHDGNNVETTHKGFMNENINVPCSSVGQQYDVKLQMSPDNAGPNPLLHAKDIAVTQGQTFANHKTVNEGSTIEVDRVLGFNGAC